MTKEDTKIFIDTNIFLGLYNSNDSGNVKAFMKSLFKNKNVLITTEQSVNEYLRNRARIIQDFKNSFKEPAAPAYTSFISSFPDQVSQTGIIIQTLITYPYIISAVPAIKLKWKHRITI